MYRSFLEAGALQAHPSAQRIAISKGPLSPASILLDGSTCLVLPAELVAAVAPTARHATPLTMPGGELQGRYHAAAIRCVGS